MNQIAREARLPLYHQLYEILRERILLRQWKPGDRLPTESELLRTYGVSRITVRKVLFSGLVRATDYIAEGLDVPVGEELARLERLRLADGEPTCIENSHYTLYNELQGGTG